MSITDRLAQGIVFATNKKRLIITGCAVAGAGIAVAIAGALRGAADKVEETVVTDESPVEETVEPSEVPAE